MLEQLSNGVSIERRGGVTAKVIVTILTALLLFTMLAPPMARPAQAQVTPPADSPNERSIEVFYERDMVLITGYESGANVKIDVLRNEAVVGSVTGTVGADGTLEINHTGASAGDCWQGEFTPNIQPGDTVRTTIVDAQGNPVLDTNGNPDVNSSVVRDIALDFDALVADEGDPEIDNDGTVTVKGHARGTEAAPINLGDGDVLGIGLRKENRDSPWGDGQDGSKVMTAELTAEDIAALDGDDDPTTFTYVFPNIVEEDIEDVQLNGVAQSFEWAPSTVEPAVPSELTVFDASEGLPPGCPPLEGSSTGPVDEPVPNVNQDLNPDTNLSAPVEAGRTLEVFHGVEFVGLNNYPANTEVRVDVVRKNQNGENVVVGSTTQRTDGTGVLEINHLGEGQFPDGDCWDYPGTPDIRPGDTVMATVLGPQGKDTTDVDTTVVRDVFIDTEATKIDTSANTITLQGHVRGTDAAPIDTQLDVLELRLNANGFDWQSGERPGRKDMRAQLPASQINPTDGSFTHTFQVTATDAANASTLGFEQALEWSPAVVEPNEPSEITVFDGTDLETVGCPPLLGGSPANSVANAITGSSHQFVNANNVAQGQIVLSGTSYGKDEVRVSVAGGTEVTATPVALDAAAPNGLQTWRATVNVNLVDPPQGPIEASATFVDSEAAPTDPIVSDTAEMMKDIDLPGAPTASKPSGTYNTAQRVTLQAEGARIYYTTDGSDPATNGSLYTSLIEVIETDVPNEPQTIKAIAVDRAGNVSGESTFTYTIAPPPNTKPTVTRMAPANGVTIRNKRPTIAATVTDAETNLSRNNIRLIVRGEEIRTFSYNRTTDRLTYTPRKNLRVGLTPVRIIATDAHGGRANVLWSFTVRR